MTRPSNTRLHHSTCGRVVGNAAPLGAIEPQAGEHIGMIGSFTALLPIGRKWREYASKYVLARGASFPFCMDACANRIGTARRAGLKWRASAAQESRT
jgi:hypothetical protein